MKDGKKRSFAKTLTWRVVATLIGIGGIFMITGDAAASSVAGTGISLVKGVFYYAHERFWETTNWERE